jgi:hypothetical protein
MNDITDYTSVPAGVHRVRIAEVRQRETRAGDVLFALHLVVADGEYEGRTAAWDNIVFSARGLTRVRIVFAALGIDGERLAGPVTPEHLVDGEAMVTVRPAEYLSADGQAIRRNEVPFDGWRPA